MNRQHLYIALALASLSLLAAPAVAQTAQHGADVRRAPEKLQIEYVGYRQARYETEELIELVVLANDAAAKARYEAAYQAALAEEEKTFE